MYLTHHSILAAAAAFCLDLFAGPPVLQAVSAVLSNMCDSLDKLMLVYC
jgi:hypothetical protein